MPKIVKNVTEMEIDEISLVDRGANQHALVTIAKRAEPEEEQMPDIKLFDEEGTELPEDVELEDGQVVYDIDGQAYRFEVEPEAETVEDETKELEPVGKRDPFSRKERVVKTEKTFSAKVLEDLSKAFSDEDRDKVLSKAFERYDDLEKRLGESVELAKAERTLRLEREYISKASEYNVPVDPSELGPVLMRMADTMSFEDCSVVAKCLEAAGDLIFSEIGAQGGGDNQDIMSRVNAYATEEIGKADAGVVTDIFDANPEAYDEYLAQGRG